MNDLRFLPPEHSSLHCAIQCLLECLNDIQGVLRAPDLSDELKQELSKANEAGIKLTRVQSAAIKKARQEYEDRIKFYRQLCAKQLRDYLFTGRLQAFAFLDTGLLVELPPTLWGDEVQYRRILESGVAPAFDGRRAALGHVMINDKALDDLLDRDFRRAGEADDRVSVVPAKQQTTSKRGRPEGSPWQQFYVELACHIHEEGLPKTQAELCKYMADWCQQQWGIDEVPSETTLKAKIRPIFQRLRPGDK